MFRVAIYCRLSDEDRNKKSSMDDSESIQNQKNLLMNYAVDKGWSIYKIYSDDDYSGLNVERPEFNRMLKDGEEGKFNIILCKTQSRFTRDMEVVEKYLHNKFLEWGIRFVTVVDGVDTLDKNNKKSRQINGLVNEWYCEDLSESIKTIFRMKQKRGEFIGSFPPYGYMKDPKNRNKLIVDREAAEIVNIIFKLYTEGNGTHHIANILNGKNIPNPTKYKQLKGFKYKNSFLKNDYGFWNKTTIKRILKNQLYIGNMVQHKCKKINYKTKKMKNLDQDQWIIVENTHEAIVDKNTFYLVQKRIKSKIKSTKKGEAHIFAGKVKCLDCKNTMAKNNNGNGYSYLRCRCYLSNTKKKLCTSHSIRLEELEYVILERINAHMKLIDNNSKIAAKLLKEQCTETNVQNLNRQLRNVNKEINLIMDASKNIYFDKVRGIISEIQFKEYAELFLKEKEFLKLKKEDINKKICEIENKLTSAESLIRKIDKYKKLSKLTHYIVNELIDCIEIGEKDKFTMEQEVRVHWNF
ncbi:recombinase family protein [Clostridiaceae bacterium UIB06]|uniref:Recombinase family protein n=1 Tax=Clostridium thailandense TaxID=2794346 RepID=A0A949TUL1_9CLOT|nr:recombinase family protein [Clostridium thailandense]MBV7271690.1 recombinase family protein [Clostridium thailandense]MCH5136339.1 recombinase family protein [Clostridiaceae bacterium UIB06]